MTENGTDKYGYVEKRLLYPELREDGWYYLEGYRFHGVLSEDKKMFDKVLDLEKIEEKT